MPLLCRCPGEAGEVVLAFGLEGGEAAVVAGGGGMTLGAGRSFVEG